MRGCPPVATSSRPYPNLPPAWVRTSWHPGSTETTRVRGWNVAPVSPTVSNAVFSTVKSGSVHSFFDSAGRGNGDVGSSPRMPMLAVGSCSWMPWAAASAAIPPPMIRWS